MACVRMYGGAGFCSLISEHREFGQSCALSGVSLVQDCGQPFLQLSSLEPRVEAAFSPKVADDWDDGFSTEARPRSCAQLRSGLDNGMRGGVSQLSDRPCTQSEISGRQVEVRLAEQRNQYASGSQWTGPCWNTLHAPGEQGCQFASSDLRVGLGSAVRSNLFQIESQASEHPSVRQCVVSGTGAEQPPHVMDRLSGAHLGLVPCVSGSVVWQDVRPDLNPGWPPLPEPTHPNSDFREVCSEETFVRQMAPWCCCCGLRPTMITSPTWEVQHFVSACAKIANRKGHGELLSALNDLCNYCPACIIRWHARSGVEGCQLGESADCVITGPRFFCADYADHHNLHHAQGLDAADFQERCDSDILEVSATVAASLAEAHSVSSSRLKKVSRRTRRRRNRRLRSAGFGHSEHALGPVQLEPQRLIGSNSPCLPAKVVQQEAVNLEKLKFCPGPCLPAAAGSPNPNLQAGFGGFAKKRDSTGLGRQVSSQEACAWDRLMSSLQGRNQAEVVDAVEYLETQGLMQEDTFPCKAAELSVEAGDAVPWHVATWAVQDVIANLNAQHSRQEIQFLSANVTRWRKDLVPWIAEHKPLLCLLQETHVTAEQGDIIATHVAYAGYNVFSVPGHPTEGGGTSGGLAVCFRKHLDVRKVHQFDHKGAGFQAVALRIKDMDVFIVNVYLRSGEGFQSKTNVAVLSHLIPFLRSVKGEFIAVGDFNEDFEIMASTNLEQEVRGSWVHVNESTCAGGGNLDYGVLSPSLASGASLTLDWITPFAPHAALRWKINLKHLDMCVPQLASFKPSPICPQPFVENAQQGRANALYAPGQEPSILGVPVAHQSLAGRFAELSEAVELATYGVTQGRGVQPKLTRAKLLHPVAPAACWGGAKASFWRRMVVWLESCLKSFHVSPFAAYAKSRLRGVWWGDPVELEVFSSKLVSLMELGDFSVTQNLLSVAAEQFHNHTKSWMKDKSATYRSWLTQASHKGLRGLFRSVKAEEAVHIRPFLEVPLQERIYLRWRQWFDLWTGPQGVDADLFADLKAKAMAQAKSLGPIPLDKAVSLFKKVPTKAPGLDGWTCEILQNLQQPAVQAILDFLHHCECEASWPDQMVFALIALLPKSEKRERPIALLHVLYRAWVRLRWKLVSDWQLTYAKSASWDKAVPGSQVLDVALSRMVLGESVRREAHHLITVFLDMETFYDRCLFNDIIRSGFRLGYPALILHQALLSYLGPRFVQSEGALCPPIFPSRGVLAGCPAAPSISKLVVHPIAERLHGKSSVTNLDIWIDDLSLDSVSKSAKQVAADCLKLFRGLRTDLEARGAKVSLEKTAFVASSAKAAKALQAIRVDSDPQIRTVARDLGVTSMGARRRVLGLAEHRRRKACKRSQKLNRLGIQTQAHRVRIVRASICAAGLWGHQAVGVSPKRRKWYRTLCAKHIGRQKLGSLDMTFLVLHHKCEDPHLTLLRQHFRSVARVFRKWQLADPDKFASTWASIWTWLIEAPQYWKRVNGPFSALLAYCLDLGIVASQPNFWSHGENSLHLDWKCPDAARHVWQWVVPIWEAERLERISGLEGCQDLKDGVDTVVPHRLLKRRFFNKSTTTNLQALWQGALLGASKPGWCKLCKCHLSLQHVLWDCPFISNKFPEPLHLQKIRANFPWGSLWLRGLVPRAATQMVHGSASKGFYAEGLFASQAVISDDTLVYATDASGGPGAKDPRSICVAWAIAAYRVTDGVPHRVASVTCFPPQPLSVASAEQQAALELFYRVEGKFDVTVDCKAITHILLKTSPPLEGQVAWGKVWHDRQRADVHWVPSHKTEEYFVEHNIPEWRRLINKDVDGLCGERAAQVFAAASKPNLREVDQACEDVSLHLARKIGHILLRKKDKEFPWILQRKDDSWGEPVPKHAKVIPTKVFDKASSACVEPNKKQKLKRMLATFDPVLGHEWRDCEAKSTTNFTIQCAKCRLYIEQCNAPTIFKRKTEHPCMDIPAPLPENWEVHPSHELLNKGPFFTCSKCLAVVKIAATSTSKVIQAPCQGLSRRSMGLKTQAHAKVAAKQNHSIVGLFARPSLAGQSQASHSVEGRPNNQPITNVVGEGQVQAKATSNALVAPKAKQRAAVKPKPLSRPPEPKQKLLVFKK